MVACCGVMGWAVVGLYVVVMVDVGIGDWSGAATVEAGDILLLVRLTSLKALIGMAYCRN